MFTWQNLLWLLFGITVGVSISHQWHYLKGYDHGRQDEKTHLGEQDVIDQAALAYLKASEDLKQRPAADPGGSI